MTYHEANDAIEDCRGAIHELRICLSDLFRQADHIASVEGLIKDEHELLEVSRQIEGTAFKLSGLIGKNMVIAEGRLRATEL